MAIALAGCQTTAEKSAKLEKEALLHVRTLARSGLTIGRESRQVKVLSTTVLRSSEGAVAVVTLRNTSPRAMRAVPLALTVKDASGRTIYQNNAAGLEAALVSVPSLPAYGESAWVDDQVPANGGPASASARVGEAPAAPTALPQLSVAGVRLIEDPTSGLGASGTVSNHSPVAQANLVIFAVARRAGRIVAAGRAALAELAAGSSLPFQLFFIGDARGAQLQVSAPASTLR